MKQMTNTALLLSSLVGTYNVLSTKTTPIRNIDEKYHIKRLENYSICLKFNDYYN